MVVRVRSLSKNRWDPEHKTRVRLAFYRTRALLSKEGGRMRILRYRKVEGFGYGKIR